MKRIFTLTALFLHVVLVSLAQPGTQASAIVISPVTTTSLKFDWTAGNAGNKVLVIIRNSTSAYVPLDGVNPVVAGTVFPADGTGADLDGGTGQIAAAVFANTGTTVTVTGLTQNTAYFIEVFEYTGSGASVAYNRTFQTGNPTSFNYFTSSVTWTVPLQVTSATVQAWGGGGGGGWDATNTNGAAGGGGGAYASDVVAVTAGAGQTITIGAGGAGGIASSTTSGVAGGATSFNANVIALGGAVVNAGATGAAGGSGAGSTGATKFSGGAGGNGGIVATNGGGGGGSVGTRSGIGVAGNNFSTTTGGAGGDGLYGDGGNGGNNTITTATGGFFPGGGGGGRGDGNGDSGAGAGGLIIVSYLDTTAPTLTLSLPVTSTTVNNAMVTYTITENLGSGSITWNRTSGTADGSSPHVQALVGGELTANQTTHTLTNNPTLVSGAVYTVTFNGTDPSGNAATPIVVTGVTFDNTAPTVSSSVPVVTGPNGNAIPRTGTITSTTGAATVVGVGTLFNSEVAVGSIIKDGTGTTIGTVLSITDDLNLTLTANGAVAVTGGAYTVGLYYTVTFSEPVQAASISAADFTVTGAGGGTGTVGTPAASNGGASSAVFIVPVTITAGPNGSTLRLDKSANAYLDVVGNSSTTTFTGGTVDNVDLTAPGVTSSIPITTPTNGNIPRTGTITSNTGSAAVVGVGTTFVAQLVVGSIIKDGSGTVIGTVQSITDNLNLVLTANAAINVAGGAYTMGLYYTFVFNESVQSGSISAADFTLTGTGTGTIGSISPSVGNATTYIVNVNPTGAGTLRLDKTADAYLDVAGNSSTTTFNGGSSATIDLTLPVLTLTLPVTSTTVLNAKVTYTRTKTLATGTITWARTSGTADGSSPHVQALTGAGELAADNANYTLTNNPTLVSGTVYTVTFAGTDLAGNLAVPIVVTAVTFDNTAPTVSSIVPIVTGPNNNAIPRTGTITSTLGAATVVGVGTLFNSEVAVGSIIKDGTGATIGTVLSITDDLNLTLAANGAVAVTGGAYTVGLYYTVTFSEPVQAASISAADFTLTATGAATGTVGTPAASNGGSNSAVFIVPVTITAAPNVSTLRLDKSANAYLDVVGNSSTTTFNGGTVDNTDITVPTVSSSIPIATPTNGNIPRTGTITCNTGSTAVVGVGTTFVAQLVVGSIIKNGSGTVIGTVQSITDNLNLVLTANAAINVAGGAYTMGLYYTVTFSESVQSGSISIADFNLSGAGVGTIGSISPSVGNSATYIVNVTPTGNGALKLDKTADAYLDIPGNSSVTTFSGGSSATVDLTAPTVSSIVPVITTVNNGKVPRNGTITASNASPNITGAGTTFTTQVAVGTVLYNCAGTLIGTVQTITDNTHIILTSNAAINVAAGGAYKVGLFYTVTFTEAVTTASLSAADFSLTGSAGTTGTIGAISPSVFGAASSTTFSVNVTPTGDNAGAGGTLRLDKTADGYTDLANNTSTTTFAGGTTTTVDITPPAISGGITFNDGGGGAESMTMTFTETINLANNTNVLLGTPGFSVSNGPVNTIKGSASKYTTAGNLVTLGSNANGDWDVSLTKLTYTAGGCGAIITDAAGNEMATFGPILTTDTTPPTLITGMVFNPNGGAAETITFNLSEQLVLSNGATVVGFTTTPGTIGSAIYSGKGSTNTITLTSTADGQWTDGVTISYTLSGSSNVKDPSANELVAIVNQPILLKSVHIQSSNPINSAYAKTGATITVSFTATSALSGTPTVNIDGNVAVVTGVFPNYSATTTSESTTGSLGFSIVAPQAIGNTTVTATTETPIGSAVIFDSTAPTVVLTDDQSDAFVRDADNVTITATFSDANGIDGSFAPPKISIGSVVTNAAMTQMSALVWQYIWDVPSGNDGAAAIVITATDVAGNANSAATGTRTSFTIDNTPPTVTSIGIDPAIVNGYAVTVNGVTPTLHSNTLDYLINFSEPVSGLDPSFQDLNGIKFPNAASVINLNPGVLTAVGGSPAIQWSGTALYTSGAGTFEVDFNPKANILPFSPGLGPISANFGIPNISNLGPPFTGYILPNYNIYDLSGNYIGTVQSVTPGTLFLKGPAQQNVLGAPFQYTSTTTTVGSGTINVNFVAGTYYLVGAGTSFLSQVNSNDVIFDGANNVIGVVQSVISNTSVALKGISPFGFGTGVYQINHPASYVSVIVDQAGNPISTTYLAGGYADISLAQPASNVASLTPTPANTSITVTWPDVASSDSVKYLVMLKNSSGTFPVAGAALKDGVFFANDNNLADGLLIQNVGKGVQSATFTGLVSGTAYSAIIYPYTLDYNCIVGTDHTAIDYNLTTPATAATTTTTGSTSTLSFNSSNASTPSTFTASNGTPVFTFTINEDALATIVTDDNSPFKFSKLVIVPGSTNAVDWATAIAGAQLTTGVATPIAGVITGGTPGTSKITFSGIPSTLNTDFGYVSDNATKSFTLRIWFNTTLGVPDNSILNFKVDNVTPTDITYDNASSSQASSQLVTSGAGSSVESGTNKISVTATAFAFTTQPVPTGQLVLTNFTTPPVVKAVDANGNVDTDFNGISVNFTNTSNIPMNPGNTTTFTIAAASGVMSFPANFQYTDQGTGTLAANSAISAVPPYPALSSTGGAGAVACSAVNVTYTNASTVTAGTGTATISSIAAGNVAVFSFTVTDDGGAGGDGAATKIKTLKFTPNASDFFGLGSAHNNFQDLIASATLTDNSGIPANTMTVTTASGVNANDITFTGIPFAAGNLGSVADNAAKIYTLSVTLKTALAGGLQSTADNKKLVFDIIRNPNITLDATGSTIPLAAPSVNSGTSNGVFQVVATKVLLDNTLNATQSFDASLSPTLQAEATDVNGTRDLDYGTAATITAVGIPANPDFATATFPIDTSPTAGTQITVSNGVLTFNATDRVTSLGNGQNNDKVNFTIASGGLASATINGITFNYSGASDIVQDGTFTHPQNLLYANFQSASFVSSASGIAIERFVIRDGGSTPPDADGTPTVLKTITLNISNFAYLRTVALYDGATKIAELPVAANITNVVGITGDLPFPALAAFQANDNGTKALTVYTTFNGAGVVDNQVVQVKVTTVTAAGVSSSFGAGGTSTAFAALGATDNQIEVVATLLTFTNPTTATTQAFMNVNYQPGGSPVTVAARDVNTNLDLDFTGIIRTTTNNTAATMIGNAGATIGSAGSGIQFGTTAFSAGTFTFPAIFKFTTGNDGDNVALTMSAGANVACDNTTNICGSTLTITLKTSFESSLQLDPTFKPTITPPPNVAYVNYQDSATFGVSTRGYELIRAMVVDGSKGVGAINYNYTNQFGQTGPLNTGTDVEANGNGDADKAVSVLTKLSVRIYGAAALTKIALYDSTGTMIPGTLIDVYSLGLARGVAGAPDTTSHVFTWNGNLLTAKDDSQAPLSIRGVFRHNVANIRDQDPLQIKLMDATLGVGSQFFNKGVAGYIGGANHNPNTPQALGTVNVIATSLDFTTQPSSYAGVKEVIDVTTNGNTGVVTARDKFAIIDLNFNYVYSISANASPTTAAVFNAGVLNLTGMQYNLAGLGTLTVTATEPVNAVLLNSNTVSSGNSIPCNRIDVINVGATINNNGVTSAKNLKGGQSAVIFGVDITPDYYITNPPSPANQPELKSLTFSFDVPYKTATYTSFSGFTVFNGATNVTNLGSTTVTQARSNPVGAPNDYDLVIVTFDPLQQPHLYTSASQPSQTQSFSLSVNISNTANSTNPKITPQLIDAGYNDPSISVTQGSAKASVTGAQYGFASTNPPSLVGATCSPFVGQLNVDPGITEIDLTFDVSVLTFDGVAHLYNRTTGLFVADLPAINGKFVSTTGVPPTVFTPFTVPVIKFKIPVGTVLNNDDVYYVTIGKGTYDPTANSGGGAGTGISDDQLNLFGGITSDADMYFKIVSSNPPKMIKTDVASYNISSHIASINASFDQRGIAYYLILDHSKYSPSTSPPTNADINDPTTFSGLHPGAVISHGADTIRGVAPQLQYFNATPASGTFGPGVTYDVWIYAQNDATKPPFHPTVGPYGAGSLFIAGTAGPTFNFTFPISPGVPVYQICPGTYSTLSQPIIINETVANKWGIGSQDFNLLLPSGFDFDTKHLPTITLIGTDFPAQAGTPGNPMFINSTLLNISFTNTGTASFDQIIISDLHVIPNTASAAGSIERFAGNGIPDVPSLAVMAKISALVIAPPSFTNTYTDYNNFAVSLKLPSIVTSVPDNYLDWFTNNSTPPNTVTLQPSLTGRDYYSSTFSGAGVTNGVLTLTAVNKNAAFKITMNHNDPNGCPLAEVEQYTVYDHTNILPKFINPNFINGTDTNPNNIDKIGLQNSSYKIPINVVAGGSANPITPPSSPFNYNDIAGYRMDSLAILIPIEAKPLGTGTSTDQIIQGSTWQNQLTKVLTATIEPAQPGIFAEPYINAPYPKYYLNYKWDYAHILNAKPEAGLPDPYSYFFSTTPPDALNHKGGKQTFYTGGSLGLIDIVGRFQNTADQTVYQPLVQRLEMFVPPLPVIEVNGQSIVLPPSGAAADSIYVFCEFGVDLLLHGYPLVLPGTSVGSFQLFDDTYVGPGTGQITPTTGFTDNGNGTATVSPKNASVALKNGHKTIRVEYTFQENSSPIAGKGIFYIQIAPNPVADFTWSSIPLVPVKSPNASISAAICANNKTDFTATINNSKYTYKWNFGDVNSAFNAPPPTLALDTTSHTFGLAQTYSVSLDLVSDLGCPSVPTGGGNTVGSQVKAVKVGEIPTIDFKFLGSCAKDSTRFIDNSSLSVGSNSKLGKFVWDFGDTHTYTGYNTLNTPTVPTNYQSTPDGQNLAAGYKVFNAYTNAGSYLVTLTTTTDLGCQNIGSKYVGQLPVAKPTQLGAFTEYFDGANSRPTNGGWITLDTDPSHPIPEPIVAGGKSSWQYDATAGNWTTTGSYASNENSALYTACLDLSNVPRPVISFASNINLGSGEGLTLQYSSDSLNIQDPAKHWEVLGTPPNATKPGLEWYNDSAIPSHPGTGYPNAKNNSGFGWDGAPNLIHPRHQLDTLLGKKRAILRFAFASFSGGGTGVTIDSLRVGSRTRTILFENFTTTNAGTTNSQLNQDLLTDENFITSFTAQNIASTQLVNINYHIGFLEQDPFNLANPPDPSARALYYNIHKVPYAFLDGKHSQSTGQNNNDLFKNWGSGAYDLQTLNLAKANFQVAGKLTKVTTNNVDGSIIVDVNVTPGIDMPASTVLQIAVLEESVPAPSAKVPQNMISITGSPIQFNYVLKKLIPDATGTKFPTGTLKDTVHVHLGPQGTVNTTDKFTWVADAPFGPNKYAVVVFLQDEVTKEVYQADLFQGITPPTATVTGIEPINPEEIKVYPNPSDQEFTIALPAPAQQSMKITMANQLGQFTEVGSIGEGEQTKKVSTSGLTDGVYILQLGSNGNALRTKVLVIHK